MDGILNINKPAGPTSFEIVQAVRRLAGQLAPRAGHEPTPEELGASLPMRPEKVKTALQLSTGLASLDAHPHLDDSRSNLGELVAEHSALQPEGHVMSAVLKQEIAKRLSSLAQRERDVIIHRFGLTTGWPMTLEQIGQKLGVSRERIRQIEVSALKNLRSPHRAQGLREFFID